jgi:hypothetical protein
LQRAIDSQKGMDPSKLLLHSDYTEENTMPKFLLNTRR